MKILQEILSQDLINAIGWTLIHSIWQGSLIALALGVLFWVLHKKSAQTRYVSALAAMLLMFIVSVGTFVYFFEKQGVEYVQETAIISEMSAVSFETMEEAAPPPQVSEPSSSAESKTSFWEELTVYFHRHLPVIVVVWLMGVVLLLLRLIGSVAYVQRLKNYRTRPVGEKWQKKLGVLASKLQVSKSVRLIESAIVKTPMVIGHLKPVILVPVGVLSGLPSEQMEVILAHELAHIRRYDYLVNLFQKTIDLLFFYHPAVWWMSAMVRTEREHCCDDLAVEISGDSITFAKALANIQEMSTSYPQVALAFMGRKKRILSRVNRLLKGSHIEFSPTEGFIMAGILFFSIFMLNLNANARLEPHEAVEFMGGGIENTMLENNNVKAEQEDTSIIVTSTEPDTVIVPSDVAVEVSSDIDVITEAVVADTVPQTLTIVHEGQTFSIVGNNAAGSQIIHVDSLMKLAEVPHAISLSGIHAAPMLIDTIVDNVWSVQAPNPPEPVMAINMGRQGGYVPISERFSNVTGTFTINYDEEDRKYKTIKLTFNKGEVIELEVNDEKISKIAIEAMITEIDREGREYSRKQSMQRFNESGYSPWQFGEDGAFHWNGEDYELNEEWEENWENQIEIHREQIEKAREQMEIAREQMEAQREAQEEVLREHRAHVREQEEHLQLRAREMEREHREGMIENEKIVDELFRDKLIDSKDDVELEISEDKMEVNGEEQPEAIREKYLDLIRDIKDIELSGDATFNIRYSADEDR